MQRLFIGIALVASIVATVAQSRVLDLTQLKAIQGTNTSGQVTISTLGPASHVQDERLPLEVKLESLDRADYREYDSVLLRVTLRNRGQQPIAVPWEPNPQQVAGTAEPNILRWLLTLRIVTGPKKETFAFPVATLYGSRTSPATMLVIQPGDFSEIIAEATLKFLADGSESRARQVFGPEVDVSARFAFLTAINGHWYEDLDSANRVPIQFTFRRP